MKKLELEKDQIVQEWFATIEAKKHTRLNYLSSMQHYTEYIKKTPVELLEEAEEEIKNGCLMRKRKIKSYLLRFRGDLKDRGLAPKTVRGYMTGVKSFYATFDIDLPKINNGSSFAVQPLEKHKKIPVREDIVDILKFASVRNRAIVLSQCNSGLAQDDMLNLKVGDFLNGYDEITGVTTLQLRRGKVQYDFITFLGPEASQAVNDYLKWRNRPVTNTGEKKRMERKKRLVNSDSDFLFIKTDIEDTYLHSMDDSDRKLNPGGLMDIYRELARITNKETPFGDWATIRSHNMRKYFNSALLNAGADIFFVDFVMGHKIDETRAAYFRADPTKLKERYIRYLPFLAIEETQVKIVESDEYKKLKEENLMIKKQLDEINTLLTGIMRQQNNDFINPDLMEELYKRDPELLKSRFGIDDEEYQQLRDVRYKKLYGMNETEHEKYNARKKKEFFNNLSEDEIKELLCGP